MPRTPREDPDGLLYSLPPRLPGECPGAYWAHNRDALVWIAYRAGASQRAIALAHDLTRAQVRGILQRYYAFREFAQRRRNRKILSPMRIAISELRRARK